LEFELTSMATDATDMAGAVPELGWVLILITTNVRSHAPTLSHSRNALRSFARPRSDGRPWRVLISNDDGVSAPGLRALVSYLRRITHTELYVCGPFGERSGQSNAISIGGRGPLHAFEIPSIPGVVKSYAVDGTPADSIIVALRTNLVVEDPVRFDLVVSGINRGDNSGIHVVYSGTCGAAREANHHGIPSVAFSLDDHNARSEESYGFSAWTAAHIVRETLDSLAVYGSKAAFSRTVINVNMPGIVAQVPVDLAFFEGIHLARQGRHSSTSTMVEVDVEDDFHEKNAHKDTEICLNTAREKRVMRAFRHTNFRHVDDQTPGTDYALLSQGWATVTVLDSMMDVPLHPADSAVRYDAKHVEAVRGIVARAAGHMRVPACCERGEEI